MRTSVLLLAVAGSVFGQNSDAACSSSNGLTIENQSDAGKLSGCTTFTGSITVASQTSGTINFSGVRQITGDLKVDGATNVTAVAADSLQKIGGRFTLNNLQLLTTVSFPQLTDVGDITFTGLPNLSQLGFGKNIQQVKTLNIQNTFLSSLTGINLQNVNSVYIANNRLLQMLSFQVTRISQNVILLGNGDQFDVAFPNLETAQNITIRTVRSVSIPSLKNVTGNLGFYESSFSNLTAVNLTSVGQTFAVNANPNLNNITFPQLKTIGGGFQVQNNTQLTSVTFPAVESIGGAFDFYGAFDTVSLPALKDIRGGFNLQSSGEVDCGQFQRQASSNGVIKGVYRCQNKVSNPGNASSTGGSSKKNGSGSVNTNIPAMLVGAAGLVAGIMASL